MNLRIEPQRYPTHTGELPLSYAIYDGDEFLAYSWTIEGAAAGIEEIQRSLNTNPESSHDATGS